MYQHHFALTETPFDLVPDPRFLYLSRQHREALNHLLYGIKEKKGFILLTGGIGVGKTTVCRTLLACLEEEFSTALILNPPRTAEELLEVIIAELEIAAAPDGRSRLAMFRRLSGYLLDAHASGRNVVVIIDEAHLLPAAVLEELRLLSNLETQREKLMQIVLLGQPELLTLLRQPNLRQLNERIAVRYRLAALSAAETRRYVEHRLAVAGGGTGFSRPALALIYHYSRGTPRRINIIADRALLIAYARGKNLVRRGQVRAAIRELGRDYFLSPFPAVRPSFIAALTAALAFYFVVQGLWR